MSRLEFAWPQGLPVAVTFSWDDGHTHDRRVVEIMNQHGCKGSFNLNSGLLGTKGTREYIQAAEVATLYTGHEVAVHSVSHPFPSRLPPGEWLREVLDDKHALEDLVGYPMRGGAWPFGDYNQVSIDALAAAGIRWCRTVNSHGKFHLPEADQWLTWHPTCHHKNNPDGKFRWLRERGRSGLVYVWSHGFEMEDQSAWGWLHDFCRTVGSDDQVWHATNSQVYDYVEAWRRLDIASDGRMAFNPSAQAVWLTRNGSAIACLPGAVTNLATAE